MEHKCVWRLTDEQRAEALGGLKDALAEVEAHDGPDDREVRRLLVLSVVALAAVAGLESGFAGGRAFIELPTGQVSWSLSIHSRPWDHSLTQQKHDRVREFLAS
jgi:hypothetical protein